MAGGRKKGDSRGRRLGTGLDITAGVVLSAGFSLITSALAGLYLGIALDRRRGSALFAPIGLLLGLLAGLHRTYILFSKVAKRKGH